MNLILLLEEDLITKDRVILYGRRLEHISKVHRANTGDTLNVGLLNSLMGRGKIISMDKRSVEMEITLDHEPPPPLPLTLVIALPRPKMLRRILQSAAALGIKEIYIINSWRVEKSFWLSPFLAPDRLKNELITGLEQAKDTIMPKIYLKRLFKPFVTEELLLLAKGGRSSRLSTSSTSAANNSGINQCKPVAITAHPGAIYPCPERITQSSILVMGPEGGFIDIEIATLEQAGFTTVNIGRRILRLETAVPFIVSKLY
ncbi:MAG: 16S rRNA (uracil(1498)-N(3))-methyltransferase [Desulfamplus sp.]|nr:16S rRNA (uracil(1498)-N(3))-methyltransferase [Desulfamplus sp.]